MYIEDFIWLDEIIEKLEHKHKTLSTEVEHVFDSKPHFRYIAKGRSRKEEKGAFPFSRSIHNGSVLWPFLSDLMLLGTQCYRFVAEISQSRGCGITKSRLQEYATSKP